MYRGFFDGSCEPRNPGGRMGWGFVIYNEDAMIGEGKGRSPANRANSCNVAEYLGFNALLRWLLGKELQQERVLVCGDSMLVIKQMFGKWRIKGGRYAEYAREGVVLKRQFPRLTGQWVPRRQNQHADRLSRQRSFSLVKPKEHGKLSQRDLIILTLERAGRPLKLTAIASITEIDLTTINDLCQQMITDGQLNHSFDHYIIADS